MREHQYHSLSLLFHYTYYIIDHEQVTLVLLFYHNSHNVSNNCWQTKGFHDSFHQHGKDISAKINSQAPALGRATFQYLSMEWPVIFVHFGPVHKHSVIFYIGQNMMRFSVMEYNLVNLVKRDRQLMVPFSVVLKSSLFNEEFNKFFWFRMARSNLLIWHLELTYIGII